ncbi:MAG: hypothetical protein V3V74_07355 [Nitrosomonadaceae bacterium]
MSLNQVMTDSMIAVSYGVGWDSTAMLVEMHNRGIRPDIIMFADTGSEWPETYEYLPVMNEWLERVGFPQITVVKYKPVRASYDTLESKCFHNETLPSLAFFGHSCSIVFKQVAQIKYLKAWQPAKDAIARGEKIIKVIGYDNSAADRKRRKKADATVHKILTEDTVNKKTGKVTKLCVNNRLAKGLKPLSDQWEAANCEFTYYLQDWELERPSLPAIIRAAGLPLPHKSACYFCPASQPCEVMELKEKHPHLYNKAIEMERNARGGTHGLLKVEGLGLANLNKETGRIGWSWEWLKDCKTDAEAYALLRARGIKIKEKLRP